MATTFYLRSANIGISGYRLNALGRGAGSVQIDTATATSGTTTSGTANIAGPFFATPPLVGFTFAGSVTVSCRGSESNGQANAALRYRLYKWSPVSGLSAAILTLTQTAELTTTDAAVSLTGTPTSTTFANGDCLVLEVALTNAGGAMGSGRTVGLTVNGATANAAGDSFFTITENVLLKQRATTTG